MTRTPCSRCRTQVTHGVTLDGAFVCLACRVTVLGRVEPAAADWRRARALVGELERQRVEHVGSDWSPSQHTRAS